MPQSISWRAQKIEKTPEIMPEEAEYTEIPIKGEWLKINKGILEKLTSKEREELIEYLKRDLEEEKKDN